MPNISRAAMDAKPTFTPSAAQLCARIAAELPKVTRHDDASSSRSTGMVSGMPSRTRSRLISPAMVMSNRLFKDTPAALPVMDNMIASFQQPIPRRVKHGVVLSGNIVGERPARHHLHLFSTSPGGPRRGRAGGRRTGAASDRGHLQPGEPGWRLYRDAPRRFPRFRARHPGA